MSERPTRFRVVAAEDGMMLGNLVARRLRDVSVESARDLIRAGGVYVGRHRVRVPTVRVLPGERVTVYREAAGATTLELDELVIVHRDPHFVVVDKPAGIPVTATRATSRGTLSELLVRWLKREGNERPYVGVVHRLDRGASGLVLFTTRDVANPSLHRQFVDHTIERTYRLLVHGSTPERMTCHAPLIERASGRVSVAREGEPSARPATTELRRLARTGTGEQARTLLEATLQTGRTHQIRVHSVELGHPIVGDRRYGRDGDEASLHLHARRLAFDHPISGDQIEVVSEGPAWAHPEGPAWAHPEG